MPKKYLSLLMLTTVLCGLISDSKAGGRNLTQLNQEINDNPLTMSARERAKGTHKRVVFDHHDSFFDPYAPRPTFQPTSPLLSRFFEEDPRLEIDTLLQKTLMSMAKDFSKDENLSAYLANVTALAKTAGKMLNYLYSDGVYFESVKGEHQSDKGFHKFYSYLTGVRAMTYHYLGGEHAKTPRKVFDDSERREWTLNALKEDWTVLGFQCLYYTHEKGKYQASAATPVQRDPKEQKATGSYY